MSNINRKISRIKKSLDLEKSKSKRKVLRSELKSLEKQQSNEKLNKIKSSASYLKMKAKNDLIKKEKKALQNKKYRLAKSGKDISSIEKKIEKLDFKKFKTSDQYFFLKRNKKKLMNRKDYLIKKMSSGDNKQKYFVYRYELQEIMDDIIQLNYILKAPIKEINNKEGIKATTLDKSKNQEIDEFLPWEIQKEVNTVLDRGGFTEVEIHDAYGNVVIIKLPEESIKLMEELVKLQAQELEVRSKLKTGTGLIRMLIDNDEKRIILSL